MGVVRIRSSPVRAFVRLLMSARRRSVLSVSDTFYVLWTQSAVAIGKGRGGENLLVISRSSPRPRKAATYELYSYSSATPTATHYITGTGGGE